jgi:hypothetical protein
MRGPPLLLKVLSWLVGAETPTPQHQKALPLAHTSRGFVMQRRRSGKKESKTKRLEVSSCTDTVRKYA